jgi:hypothetical protein
MRKKLHFSFSILLIFLVNVYSFAQMFGQEPTERVRYYDVEHILLSVRLNLETKTVNGWIQTVIVPLNDNFREFEVDAVGLNITGVLLVNSKKADIKNDFFRDLSYDYDKTRIKINLGKNYKKSDTIIYAVTYEVTDPEKGLYFISPAENFPGKRYEVWSQGEGEDNRYWFPCYDYPNDMATTEMYVTIDKKYQTLSNGLLKNKKENSNGTVTWHWVNDVPQSSYLVMLGAGNWDVIEDNTNGIPISSMLRLEKKSGVSVPTGRHPTLLNFLMNILDIVMFGASFRRLPCRTLSTEVWKIRALLFFLTALFTMIKQNLITVQLTLLRTNLLISGGGTLLLAKTGTRYG